MRRPFALPRADVAVVVAALAVGSSVVAAQPTATSEMRDLRNLGGDVWAAWSSPARLDGRTLVPVGVAVGGIALAFVADSLIYKLLSNHPGALPVRLLAPVRADGLPVIKDLTTSTYLIPLSVAAYAAGRLSRSDPLRDAAMGCGASYLASLGVRLMFVTTVHRSRPYLDEGPYAVSFPGLGDWDHRSSTAGHAGNAAACASFLGNRFSMGWGEPVMYAYVGVLALGRIADGWHWTSDTMTGVIAGVAIGSVVAHRQLSRPASAPMTAVAPNAIPILRFKIAF
jgi:hypothetical protein